MGRAAVVGVRQVARDAGRELRGGLGHAPGQGDGRAELAGSQEEPVRGRVPAEQDRAQGAGEGLLLPGVEDLLEHRRNERDQADLTRVEVASRGRRIEALLEDDGRPVEGAAEEDRDPAHVVEGEAGQPAIFRVVAESDRRAEGAEGELGRGQGHRPRGPAAARGQDAHALLVEGPEALGRGRPEGEARNEAQPRCRRAPALARLVVEAVGRDHPLRGHGLQGAPGLG